MLTSSFYFLVGLFSFIYQLWDSQGFSLHPFHKDFTEYCAWILRAMKFSKPERNSIGHFDPHKKKYLVTERQGGGKEELLFFLFTKITFSLVPSEGLVPSWVYLYTQNNIFVHTEQHCSLFVSTPLPFPGCLTYWAATKCPRGYLWLHRTWLFNIKLK